MPTPAQNRDWLQQAEQQFARQEEGFLETFRQITDGRLLAPLAERWASDQSSWARQQLFDYLRMSADCIGHQVVVKRLFKLAEQRGDDQLVAAFALLFDRLVRHRRKVVVQYDWRSRQTWEEEVLASEAPKLPGFVSRSVTNKRTGQQIEMPLANVRARRGALYFSHATRYYLQRRAFRYFRHIGFRDGTRYLAAASDLLARYEDDQLAVGEYLLDSRTLMHVAFRHHPALTFTRDRVRLTAGHTLAELAPAPAFPQLWQSAGAFAQLVALMKSAPARLVRVWATQILERDHAEALSTLALADLLALLTSGEPDLEEFATRRLESHPGLGQLTVDEWLALVATPFPTAQATLVELARRHIDPTQVAFDEALRLALAEPATVAEFGFQLIQAQAIDSADQRARLADLAHARCVALVGAMSRWALGHLGGGPRYDRDAVTMFFDSPHLDAREAAWEWLDDPESPGRDDPVLFCRLMETSYSDLRLRIIDLLQRRSIPGEARSGLTHLWTSVLLGVERGGRQKLKATEQIAAAMRDSPDLSAELLPVLVTAVRSIREPESRAGLAAVVRLMVERPELAARLADQLPELALLETEEVAG